MKKRVIDKRQKEKFMMDDAYLNGMARICGWQATLVYLCLCRHADKEQECFPSIKLMQEKLGVGYNTIRRGISNLEKNNVIGVEREKDISGRWLNNTYILIDKTEWKNYNHSPNKDVEEEKPQPYWETFTALIEKSHSPNTNNKETHIKETHIKDKNASVLGKETNEIISLFKAVNPSFEQLFARSPQRQATARLLAKFGAEKLTEIINFLPRCNSKKYAPTITTPLQLENKMGELAAFAAKERSAQKGIIDIT